MEMTSDAGATWERTPALNKKDTAVIQPTLLLYKDGRLEMLCRSKIKSILSSWSSDYGITWSPLKSTGLPNPNSGIDAVSLSDERKILVYNHLVKDRYMLNVAVSDNGSEWNAAVLLENDQPDTEYSYPAVIQTSDGMIHITYTWNRKLIKHVIIDPARIISKPFKNGHWPE
jgi:predicted neuraminidase